MEKAPTTKGWSYPIFDEHYNYGMPQELRHFARCVRGKEEPLLTGEDGRLVLEIMLAAYASAREGRKIALPFRPQRRAPAHRSVAAAGKRECRPVMGSMPQAATALPSSASATSKGATREEDMSSIDRKPGLARSGRVRCPAALSCEVPAAGGLGLAAAPLIGSGKARADEPKRGGNLRVAMLGGGTSDTLDAHSTIVQTDLLRVMLLYNCLTSLDVDAKVVKVLAESIEPNATATEWTIRLRPGVTFHDGKALTAEDVAFTFRRIADPKAPLNGARALQPLDLNAMKIMDERTLRLTMQKPYAAFPEDIAVPVNFGIVPVGYDPKKPVGTGPFKFESFTPGQQSVFTRFDGYWDSGLPHLDSVTVLDLADETAGYNALQGGQVDVFANAPLALARQVGSGGAIKALVSKPGQWTPFTMRVDQPPFDNPDVRMALRLLVDRQQIINLSLSGYGQVANDVFAPWDPCYDSSLKRGRDLEQAKFLLKKAGQENCLARAGDFGFRRRRDPGSPGLRPAGQGCGRHRQGPPGHGRCLLRRPISEMALRPGLLVLQPLSQPMRAGLSAGLSLQRDPLGQPCLQQAL